MARIRSEMRAELFSSSSAMRSISRSVAKRVSSEPTDAPAASAKRARWVSARLASARCGASFQASGTLCDSSQDWMASSRSTRANSSLNWAGVSEERISSSVCASFAQSLGPIVVLRAAARRRARQSRRAAAERRAAADGLFSSCASPAESLPREASFSRCCSVRVTSRMRSANRPTNRRVSSGILWKSSGKLEAGNIR